VEIGERLALPVMEIAVDLVGGRSGSIRARRPAQGKSGLRIAHRIRDSLDGRPFSGRAGRVVFGPVQMRAAAEEQSLPRTA
jgi:hypothetical protein